MDSQVIQTIRSADIKFDMGRKFSQVFGTPYPGCPIAGKRKISFACDLYDGSDAATKDLYSRHYDKNPFTVQMVIGTVAGSIWSITLNGLQLAPYQMTTSDDVYSLKFGDSYATSSTGSGEASLVLT